MEHHQSKSSSSDERRPFECPEEDLETSESSSALPTIDQPTCESELPSNITKKGNHYECPECGKKVKFYYNLKMHLLSHSESEFIKKQTETFSSESMLTTSSTTTASFFKCPKCEVVLSSRYQLKKHFLDHKPKSEWPFHCLFCQTKCRTKFEMANHYKSEIHQKDWRYYNIFFFSIKNVLILSLPKTSFSFERLVEMTYS